MNRRDFIRLMGIASGVSFLNSCRLERASDKLIPYLVPPEDDIIPGQAVYYATVCRECPAGCGMSVKIRDGSPVKVEGLPDHPINAGTLCMRGQSSLMRLYHPDRLAGPLVKNADGGFRDATWDEAFHLVIRAMGADGGKKSGYLAARTSGSLGGLIDRFCSSCGVEREPEWEIISHAALREANAILFGKRDIPFYDIERADLLITFGADIIETFVNPVGHAVQLGRMKRRERFAWTHLEPHVSLTGLQADERMTPRAGSEPVLLSHLFWTVAGAGRVQNPLPPEMPALIPRRAPEEVETLTGLPHETLERLERQLLDARAPLVVAGGVSTAHETGLEAAVLAGLMQWTTGQIGTTVDFDRAADFSRVGTLRDMKRLADELNGGAVGVLFVSRCDPLHDVGNLFSFPDAFGRAGYRVALTDLMNDTARACDVILPLSHALESWGDDESQRGVATVMQPAVEPLNRSLPEGDILLGMMRAAGDEAAARSYQEYLFKKWNTDEGETFAGGLVTTGFHRYPARREPVLLDHTALKAFLARMKTAAPPEGDIIALVHSIRTYDGRSAALELLNEIPDPLTTITYGRWLSVSEEAAPTAGLCDNDEITVTAGGCAESLHAKIQPFLPGGVYMICRDQLETPCVGMEERTGEPIGFLGDVRVKKTGHSKVLPIMSGSMSQAGRGIIPDPRHLNDEAGSNRYSLYPQHEYTTYRWTMLIDLERCIGCGACVAACYTENNVPMTGPREHLKGRELSWLRIEPYYDCGNRACFLPMLCQQCNKAPCEPVCPVYATYHNPEGLNAQVYNRCVGTRYCSNNCPYKVRRFNWFDPHWREPLPRMLNPDISVRGRGVMEKCTFCIQRIRAARDAAEDKHRLIEDGEVVPACAQTCPTQAIRFGNLLDETSEVYRLVHTNETFHVHEHLGTETSVYYLKRNGMKHGI